MGIADGSYVAIQFAAGMRAGTVHLASKDHGRGRYILRLDPRFADKLADFFVYEVDVKECSYLSDQKLDLMNSMISKNT
jgi:hypothetical protein